MTSPKAWNPEKKMVTVPIKMGTCAGGVESQLTPQYTECENVIAAGMGSHVGLNG